DKREDGNRDDHDRRYRHHETIENEFDHGFPVLRQAARVTAILLPVGSLVAGTMIDWKKSCNIMSKCHTSMKRACNFIATGWALPGCSLARKPARSRRLPQVR
ncbi:MAG: hypothetical protein AAAB14_14160, partial [Ensifer adhaerens]